jgi:hypothetical protein
MLIFSVSRSNFCKVLLQKAIFIIFWVDAIIQVQHCPSDQTKAPSGTQISQYEERTFKGFPRK